MSVNKIVMGGTLIMLLLSFAMAYVSFRAGFAFCQMAVSRRVLGAAEEEHELLHEDRLLANPAKRMAEWIFSIEDVKWYVGLPFYKADDKTDLKLKALPEREILEKKAN